MICYIVPLYSWYHLIYEAGNMVEKPHSPNWCSAYAASYNKNLYKVFFFRGAVRDCF